MALITVSGYPCSGKTKRAQELKTSLQQYLNDPSYAGPALEVEVISDGVANVAREAYNDSRSEKPARAALFTLLQRQMSQSKILIVDGMNYIKGFRYQMYCAAREQKLRVCTLYVVAPPDLCREWNAARDDVDRYAHDTLENLIMRFEELSSMVRWDSPLFTVPWTDAGPPSDQIWKAVTEGNVKPPNTGTQAVPKAPSDALQALEQTAASIVAAIMAEQSMSPGQGGLLTLSEFKARITLPARNVTLSEMQRLKRQFVTVHKKAMTLGTVEKGAVNWSEERIAEKFVEYLGQNLKL